MKEKVNYFPRREELESIKPDNVTIDEWRTYLNVIHKVDQRKLLVSESGYRRFAFQLRYFGSDLNMFIANHCTRKMTVNNIDCVILKDNIMRIIEVKREKENISETQNTLLNALADVASKNNNQFCQYNLQIYMIRCNSPFFTENKIYNYLTGDTYLIGENKLKRFLSYEYKLVDEDLIVKQLNLL